MYVVYHTGFETCEKSAPAKLPILPSGSPSVLCTLKPTFSLGLGGRKLFPGSTARGPGVLKDAPGSPNVALAISA